MITDVWCHLKKLIRTLRPSLEPKNSVDALGEKQFAKIVRALYNEITTVKRSKKKCKG